MYPPFKLHVGMTVAVVYKKLEFARVAENPEINSNREEIGKLEYLEKSR